MRHYRPGHEPEDWPFWHDLAILGIVLFLLYAMWQGLDSDSDSGPSYRPLVETRP